jgi:hypothetical protein
MLDTTVATLAERALADPRLIGHRQYPAVATDRVREATAE